MCVLVEVCIDFKGLCDVLNDEVIVILIEVIGIGVWIVEIYVMFSFGCVDVFVYGDLVL